MKEDAKPGGGKGTPLSRPKYRRFAHVTARILDGWGLTEKALFERIVQGWDGSMGPFLSGLTFPSGMKNGILYVAVGNSVLLQELFYRKPKILEKVQQEFGRGVRDLRLNLRARPPGTAPGASGKRTKPVAPPNEEDVRRATRAAEAADDGELRERLAKIFTNWAARKRPRR